MLVALVHVLLLPDINTSAKPHNLHSTVMCHLKVVVSHSVCEFVVLQISAMGDPEGNAKGGFLILDQDLKVLSRTSSSTLAHSFTHQAASACGP